MFDLSKLLAQAGKAQQTEAKSLEPKAVSAESLARQPEAPTNQQTTTQQLATAPTSSPEGEEVRRRIQQITSSLDQDIDVLDSSICSQVDLLYDYVRRNPLACTQLYPEDLGQLCRIHMRMARSGQTEEGKKKVAESKKKAKAAPSLELDLSVLLNKDGEEKKDSGGSLTLEDLLKNIGG